MKSVILTYREDQEFGGLGFYIEGASLEPHEYNMATDGRLIAHDLIEHESPELIGTIGDELKALGAAWFVRGENGQLGGVYRSPDQALASDILNMARDFFYSENGFGQDVPEINPAEEENEEIFQWMIDHAKKDVLGECQPDDEAEFWEFMEPFFINAIKFLMTGYNRAYEAWDGQGWRAWEAFDAIQDAVNKALKWMEYEGQQVELTYDLEAATASCEEYYEFEEEDY